MLQQPALQVPHAEPASDPWEDVGHPNRRVLEAQLILTGPVRPETATDVVLIMMMVLKDES